MDLVSRYFHIIERGRGKDPHQDPTDLFNFPNIQQICFHWNTRFCSMKYYLNLTKLASQMYQDPELKEFISYHHEVYTDSFKGPFFSLYSTNQKELKPWNLVSCSGELSSLTFKANTRCIYWYVFVKNNYVIGHCSWINGLYNIGRVYSISVNLSTVDQLCSSICPYLDPCGNYSGKYIWYIRAVHFQNTEEMLEIMYTGCLIKKGD